MPLVEIIRGAETSDVALAKAYDVVQQIRKTPIVVNDSRGFYTSRVIGTQINEGLTMLAEGVHPVSLERAATSAGFPVGPLQISDELNMELMAKIRKATEDAAEREGIDLGDYPAGEVISTMIGLGRPSRLKGAGFYDYDDNGRRTTLWPGLAETFPVAEQQIPIRDMRDRMLFIEALETAKCFEEGVITSAAAANIGSIMGIGFPALTGGAAQFMTGWQALDETGHGVGPDRPGRLRGPGRRAGRGLRRALPPHRPAARDGGEGRDLPRLRRSARLRAKALIGASRAPRVQMPGRRIRRETARSGRIVG